MRCGGLTDDVGCTLQSVGAILVRRRSCVCFLSFDLEREPAVRLATFDNTHFLALGFKDRTLFCEWVDGAQTGET